MELFFSTLGLIKDEANRETPTENAQETLPVMANGSLRALFQLEESLAVVIGDQLKEELEAIRDKYLNRQFDSVDGLRVRLKMQLCGLNSETSNLNAHASMYN